MPGKSQAHTDAVLNVLRGSAIAYVGLYSAAPGATYTVTNRIVTTGGRTDDRSISIKVEDR